MGERQSQYTRAAVTKCQRPGGPHNRNVFLMVLGAERSKVKVTANLGLGEGLFLVIRWLPSCCVLTWPFL